MVATLKFLFARFPLPAGALRPPRAADAGPTPAQRLVAASDAAPAELLARLGSSMSGLSAERAAEVRRSHGTNEAGRERPLPWWRHLGRCYANPFNLLLTVLAAVSWATEDLKATLVIGTMVVLSTLLRFVQEARSNRAAGALKALVRNRATVLRRDPADEAAEEALAFFEIALHRRPPAPVELPIDALVPGDIVLLAAGDMVPADLRLLAAKDLFVSEAAMTGESLPVEKFADARSAAPSPLARENLLLMGTNVVSGSGTAVVVETGSGTLFGAMADRLAADDRAPTAFQAGVNRVSGLLIRFMLVMAPLVLLINGFAKGDWLQAALFALAIAVGLTPEMLPMIVTSTLAKGAVVLARRRVVVKRLDAIQNFGAMDVLCTDKTGTLTQDRIVLERHTDIAGAPSDEVLRLAWLNSRHQTGLRNLLDAAVLAHEGAAAIDPEGAWRKVDEIPFDFRRRRMSVVVCADEARHELITKGAVEEVLAACSHVHEAGALQPLDDARHAAIRARTAALNGQGLRVVAVAHRVLPAARTAYGVADEAGLALAGWIAFLDPPKDSTAPALQALQARGIAVKVLTGDNELVTAQVCAAVGLAPRGVLLGPAIAAMDDAALAQAVGETDLFARLDPAQKERIVRTLRAAGHVVGFLGDGINDAPALRAADVGISVDSAVDIAKEAADVILLDKSLTVLEQGVVEGRRTFANMLKYIKMTASSNFGNVFSVLIASAFLPFLPMLPMQLLVQNLLYDLSQTAIPFDRVDPEALARPQRWDPADLGRFMLCFGPVSSVFDVITFWLMAHVFGAAVPAQQPLFQSGWFVEGLLSQTLVVHLIRSRRLPFAGTRAAWPVTAATLAVMAAGIALVMGPLAGGFGMTALPPAYFGALVALLLGYVALVQAVKTRYARRFGWQ